MRTLEACKARQAEPLQRVRSGDRKVPSQRPRTVSASYRHSAHGERSQGAQPLQVCRRAVAPAIQLPQAGTGCRQQKPSKSLHRRKYGAAVSLLCSHRVLGGCSQNHHRLRGAKARQLCGAACASRRTARCVSRHDCVGMFDQVCQMEGRTTSGLTSGSSRRFSVDRRCGKANSTGSACCGTEAGAQLPQARTSAGRNIFRCSLLTRGVKPSRWCCPRHHPGAAPSGCGGMTMPAGHVPAHMSIPNGCQAVERTWIRTAYSRHRQGALVMNAAQHNDGHRMIVLLGWPGVILGNEPGTCQRSAAGWAGP